jgi:hypothetical protein
MFICFQLAQLGEQFQVIHPAYGLQVQEYNFAHPLHLFQLNTRHNIWFKEIIFSETGWLM